ncbi:hypothetical protein N7454_000591 [Penicillium verhagenii]|nr:hypothetical protein N7454_000591 [Penicillium verhagenii]
MLGSWKIASWLSPCLGVSNVAALAVSDIFTLPSPSRQLWELFFVHDQAKQLCQRLLSTLATQMLYAVQWAQQTTQIQQTIVARELFTSWFGIRFDGTGALLAEIATAWAVVTEHIDRLQSLISNGGAYQAWKFPANLFCGDFGQALAWSTVMFDSTAQEVEPYATVQQAYGGWESYIGGTQQPYYVPHHWASTIFYPPRLSVRVLCVPIPVGWKGLTPMAMLHP